MIGKSRRTQVAVLFLAIALLMGATAANAKPVAKIDNFIFFVDQSGSMYMRHQECGEIVKMALAKQILSGLNELICDLGYKGSLYLFAPFQPVVTPGPYNKAKFAEGIRKIKDDQPIFDRLTPMGGGLRDLEPVLSQLTGKTAIIVISDGWSNFGVDPVAEARAIYSRFPNVCIHVISLADRKQGKAILGQINKLNNCSILVEGCSMIKEGMARFVEDVFCAEAPEAPVARETLILRGIHFDFNKYVIKPEWAPVLDEAAAKLRQNQNISVVIEGHTDAVGAIPYNQTLSEKRAGAVYDYLVRKGVSPGRMRTVGYGKTRPIADNSTEEGRAMNRRVEIKIAQ